MCDYINDGAGTCIRMADHRWCVIGKTYVVVVAAVAAAAAVVALVELSLSSRCHPTAVISVSLPTYCTITIHNQIMTPDAIDSQIIPPAGIWEGGGADMGA